MDHWNILGTTTQMLQTKSQGHRLLVLETIVKAKSYKRKIVFFLGGGGGGGCAVYISVPVNSYGQVKTVTLPNYTFSWASKPVLRAHTFAFN